MSFGPLYSVFTRSCIYWIAVYFSAHLNPYLQSPSRTGEATVHMGQARTGSEHRSISKEPTHDLASTKRNESESVDNQPFEEPLAKRFRTRKLV